MSPHFIVSSLSEVIRNKTGLFYAGNIEFLYCLYPEIYCIALTSYLLKLTQG